MSNSSASGQPAWFGEPASGRALLRYGLLVLLCLVFVLPGISGIGPIDRDESRYIQASKQMVESGDYVDIRLQEETRYKKPIGIYWLQSAVVNASGMGAEAPVWVYRIVSVAGVVLATIGVGWIGTWLFGVNGGFLAAVVLLAALEVSLEARMAKTDAMLLACAVLAQGALARVYIGAKNGEFASSGYSWLFWLAQGAGILVKGPIVPLLSAVTVGALLVFDRGERSWLSRLKPLRGAALTLLIVLPWFVAITWKSGGGFWAESVGRDLLGKVAEGQESHGAPPGTYAAVLYLFFWPFGLLAVGAVLAAFGYVRSDARLRFLTAWWLPFWLIFELIPTKLPNYVLPIYPALALTAAWILLQPAGAVTLGRRWQRWIRYSAVFGYVVTAGVLIAAMVATAVYLRADLWPWSAAVAALIAITGILAFPRRLTLAPRRFWAAIVGAGLTYAVLFGVILPRLTPIWLSPRIAQAVAQYAPCADTRLASATYHEPSLVFLVGTDTILTGTRGAADHLISDPACALALVPSSDVASVEEMLAEQELAASVLTRIEGVNYSNGDSLVLTLLKAGD